MARETSKSPWEAGVSYMCVVSASPAYKLGKVYQCYKNDAGVLCLRGDDGFEDACRNLISGFKRA